MKIKFDKIHIFTNDGEESIIYISSSLTFIYGNIGVGKSTLLNLIFFAMGGKLIPTPAVEQCLRAIQIDVFLGEGKFLLFRQKNSTNILVENVLEKQKFTVPSVKMSHFIHEQCGLQIIKTAKASSSERECELSFINYSWFSYLKQDEMENNFFNLNSDNIFKKTAAINVLLTLFDSEVLVDRLQNEKYRETKRKLRQYEEGKEVFRYLEPIYKSNIFYTSIEEEIERQLEITNTKISSKDTYTREEVYEFINEIKRIEELEIRKKFEKKLYAYEMRLANLKQEMSLFNEKFSKEIMENNEKIRKMCELFLDCLLEIKFPGITVDDEVSLDSNSYMPIIYNRYSGRMVRFDNLGSGGKRTLFKICFALALHRLHANNNCYLPRFFIIDTPMKNISEREDVMMYNQFYQYVVDLFTTELQGTQLIIIDKEKRDLSGLEPNEQIIVKHMESNSVINPPLFKNYKGF